MTSPVQIDSRLFNSVLPVAPNSQEAVLPWAKVLTQVLMADRRNNIIQADVSPAPGSAEETFESVSKNIKSWNAAFSYSGDKLSSISYTNGTDIIVKTFGYTGENLTAVELSGDTPAGISLLKLLSYTGDSLVAINYI